MGGPIARFVALEKVEETRGIRIATNDADQNRAVEHDHSSSPMSCCKATRWEPRGMSAARDRDPAVGAKARCESRVQAREFAPILPQGIEHNRADRLAGLMRQSARELGGLGIADMNLILRDVSPGAKWQPGASVPRPRRHHNRRGAQRRIHETTRSSPGNASLVGLSELLLGRALAEGLVAVAGLSLRSSSLRQQH